QRQPAGLFAGFARFGGLILFRRFVRFGLVRFGLCLVVRRSRGVFRFLRLFVFVLCRKVFLVFHLVTLLLQRRPRHKKSLPFFEAASGSRFTSIFHSSLSIFQTSPPPPFSCRRRRGTPGRRTARRPARAR